MMLCDVVKCSDNQLGHVRKILVVDAFSPKNWHDYIVYLVGKFPNKKQAVLKLLLLGLETVAPTALPDDSSYIRLNLLKASLAR